MSFKVTNVVDGDTFDVSPDWKALGKSGKRIRIKGLYAPESNQKGGSQATQKLKNLILGKVVTLRNPSNLSYGRLVCDVFLNGENIHSKL